jgi:hypothetical protein
MTALGFKEVEIDSSVALSLEHDGSDKLRVNFRNGRVYEYANVDTELFNYILGGSMTNDGSKSGSVGAALNQEVLNDEKNHPFVRVI